jgi:hypothetical protein
MSTNASPVRKYSPLECCDACGVHYTHLESTSPFETDYEGPPELTKMNERIEVLWRSLVPENSRKLKLKSYIAERRYKFEGFDCIADYLRCYYDQETAEILNATQSDSAAIATRNCIDCMDLSDDDFFTLMNLRHDLECL